MGAKDGILKATCSVVQEAVEGLKMGIVARYGDVYHLPLAWAEQDITLDWKPNSAKRDAALGNLWDQTSRRGSSLDG